MKKLLILFIAAALIFSGCGKKDDTPPDFSQSTDKAKDDIVFGIVLPIDDDELINGIQLAINEINLAGGINGSQVLVSFLNYENGKIYGIEGMKVLETRLFINLTNKPVFDQLKEFDPAILTLNAKCEGETSFCFSGYNASGFEQLYLSKNKTKPDYVISEAYEMVYMGKQLVEVSVSQSPEDLRRALGKFNFKGRYHKEVTVVQK